MTARIHKAAKRAQQKQLMEQVGEAIHRELMDRVKKNIQRNRRLGLPDEAHFRIVKNQKGSKR